MNFRPFKKEDAAYIVDWNKETDESFLHQWAGTFAYDYPITCEQILLRSRFEEQYIYVLEVNNSPVATVELGRVDDKTMRFGRLLVDPRFRGKGYGKQAIDQLENLVKHHFKADIIELGVFEFNRGAKSLYERLGYLLVHTKVNDSDVSLNSHTMRKSL